MTEPSSLTTARVTRQDVLDALGDTDPFRTNAGAIRSKLGRGGNSTIQKILNEIRNERSAPPAPLDSDVPPPPAPADLLNSLWQASWRHAQLQTLSRLDKATHELAQLKETHALLSTDYDELCQEIDEMRDTLNNLTGQLSSLKVAHADELSRQAEAHATELAQHQQSLQALKSAEVEWSRERELTKRDIQLQQQSHQLDREHLLNQISELKSLLYRLQPQATQVTSPQATSHARSVPQVDLPLSEDLI